LGDTSKKKVSKKSGIRQNFIRKWNSWLLLGSSSRYEGQYIPRDYFYISFPAGMNETPRDKDRSVRKRVQDAAENLDEKIGRMDISEDAKHSILDNLNWLLAKSRECNEEQSARFLNSQIRSLLDLVDSKSSDHDDEVTPTTDDYSSSVSPSSEATFTAGNDRQSEGGEPPHHNYGRDQLLRLMPDDKPDIVLNVPNVSVDQINFEINNLSARVALDAAVAQNAVQLFVGVDVHLERVKLTIDNIQACAQLIVRLDNVRKIVDRALEAVDSDKHPSVLGMTQGLLKR